MTKEQHLLTSSAQAPTPVHVSQHGVEALLGVLPHFGQSPDLSTFVLAADCRDERVASLMTSASNSLLFECLTGDSFVPDSRRCR